MDTDQIQDPSNPRIDRSARTTGSGPTRRARTPRDATPRDTAPHDTAPRDTVALAWFLGGLVLVLAGWPVVARLLGADPGPVVRTALVAVTGSLLTVVAAGVTLRAAASRGGRNRLAWGSIGIGTFLLAVGTLGAVLSGATPLGEVAATGNNALQSAGLVCCIVGAAAVPSALPRTGVSRIDGLLVAMAGLSLMWLAPLRSERGTISGLGQVLERDPWAVLDVVLILVAAVMLARCAPGRRPELRLLVPALLLYPASAYTALVGSTGSLEGPSALTAQLWWITAPVLLFGAGRRAWTRWQEPVAVQARAARVHAHLPAVAVLVTLAAVALHQRVMTSVDPVMMGIGVTAVLLAAVRVSLLQAEQADLMAELGGLAGELADQARTDALTGLGNRLALERRLADALDRAPADGVSVFFIDLDNFKNVNDALGHDAGDRLLVELALRLTDVLGSDVYRIGGDEFIAVREDLDPGRAEAVASALVAALSPPVPIDGRQVAAAASIGLARSTPRNDEGGDRRPDDGPALLRRADLALYRAKELGRGRWASYDSWLQERADRRLRLQQGLHHALERGEFEVRYQPIVELATRQVVGAEALVRWNSPEYGLLLPEEFLPIAAEAGLLPAIGRSVLELTVGHLRHARLRSGELLWVAVNLSSQEVAHPGLVDDISQVLALRGVAPHRVRLEIDEGVVMDRGAAGVLDQLVALGVGLTVQDFGTGPSSLRLLGRYPAPTIKVDRSFVAGLGRRRDDRVILEAVADLAADLGLVFVAEGVTQETQAAELWQLGAVRAQGWLFGQAVPWDRFAEAHLQPSAAPRPVAHGSGPAATGLGA